MPRSGLFADNLIQFRKENEKEETVSDWDSSSDCMSCVHFFMGDTLVTGVWNWSLK